MKKRSSGKASRVRSKRTDRSRDEDIDFSDIPETSPEWFKTARLVLPGGSRAQESVTLTLDADVVKWFRAQGRGYQVRINALLRSHMAERMAAEKSTRRR